MYWGWEAAGSLASRKASVGGPGRRGGWDWQSGQGQAWRVRGLWTEEGSGPQYMETP